MIWETVGSGGSCEHTELIYQEMESELMKFFILKTIGPPPSGATLRTGVAEHELGSYLQNQQGWEAVDETSEYWEYLDSAQGAFTAINEHVDWDSLWTEFPLNPIGSVNSILEIIPRVSSRQYTPLL